MSVLVDLFGYPILDLSVFIGCLCFLYVTSCQIIIPSCLIFVLATAIYIVVRKWLEAKRVDPVDKYVLITGCDTGFGNRFARLLDRKKFHVFATCLSDNSDWVKDLKEAGSSRMRVLQLDVTCQKSIDACFQKVKAECEEKGLWAVVNNAATAVNTDVEILDMDTYHRVFDVNMFGMVRVCKTFLPLVRRRKGRIVNITSVRGLFGLPLASAYTMSKFAGEGFTDSLRLEMKRFGIKVILVEPGMYGLETGQYLPENVVRLRKCYEDLVSKASDEIKAAYGEEYLATFPVRIPKAQLCGDEKIRGVLEALESAVTSRHPRIRYLTGSTNRWVDTSVLMVRLRRVLPVYLMDRLVLWFRPLRKESFISIKKEQ